MKQPLASLIPPLLALAREAGQAILDYYQQPEKINIELKADKSPVTEADMVAHRIIERGLRELTPEIPLLSEESKYIDYDVRKYWQQFWLVDPLDGTKEFIHRTDEFTVNIALIDRHESTLGVIYAPVFDVFYFAARGIGSYKKINQQEAIPIHVRQLPLGKIVITASRRHSKERLQTFLEQFNHYELFNKGSSLKSCLVAEGGADVYPCLGPTSEWDMAAAQCIVEEAGGAVMDLQMQPLCYNQKASLVNPSLLIVGDKEYSWNQHLTAGEK